MIAVEKIKGRLRICNPYKTHDIKVERIGEYVQVFNNKYYGCLMCWVKPPKRFKSIFVSMLKNKSLIKRLTA